MFEYRDMSEPLQRGTRLEDKTSQEGILLQEVQALLSCSALVETSDLRPIDDGTCQESGGMYQCWQTPFNAEHDFRMQQAGHLL